MISNIDKLLDQNKECCCTRDIYGEAIRELKRSIKAGDIFICERLGVVVMALHDCTQTKYGRLHKAVTLFHWGKPSGRVWDKFETHLLDDDESYFYKGNIKSLAPHNWFANSNFTFKR